MEKATPKNRINWIDNAKAFSIMAVVLYHTPVMPQIRTICYLVALPAFFFVAGFFTNTTISPKDFFLKKTLRLLIPYVIWGVLTWLFWYFVSSKHSSSAANVVEWWTPLLGMVLGKGDMLYHNMPLWFLCCMISLEWIYYAICRISKQLFRWILIIGIGVIGCVLSYVGQNWIWEITAAMIILPLYAVGAEYKTFWKERMASLPFGALVLVLVCSLGGLWIGYTYNGDIRLIDSIIGNPVLYYLSAISAVGLWYTISLLIEKTELAFTHVLHYIGRNTLLILCAHIPTFSIVKGIAWFLHVPREFWLTTTGCIVVWICTLIILALLAYPIKRYLPILTGITSPFPLSTKREVSSSKLSEKML